MRILVQDQIDRDPAGCRLPCQAAGELLVAVAVDAGAGLQDGRQCVCGELRKQSAAAVVLLFDAVDLQAVQLAGGVEPGDPVTVVHRLPAVEVEVVAADAGDRADFVTDELRCREGPDVGPAAPGRRAPPPP